MLKTFIFEVRWEHLTETAHMVDLMSCQHHSDFRKRMQMCLKYQTDSHPEGFFFGLYDVNYE